jgi:dihydropteroate synthase
MASPPHQTTALRLRDREIAIGARTYVMAILNLTEDSFSGDGTGGDIDAALRRAVAAVEDGADIIDCGGESARSDVVSRDPDEEAQMVASAIARIASETGAVVSVDTYKGPVARAALQAGAHMINDIGGFKNDTGTAETAAEFGAGLVINFTFERPKVRPSEPPVYDDLIGAHLSFLRERIAMAEGLGVAADAIVVDPGIAFGKSHDEDLQVLRRLSEFRALGRPILVAASRKHFIGSVTGLPPSERDEATAAVTALCIAAGADIVRVHDVRMNVRAARIADAIVRGDAGDYAATVASWPWASDATPIAGTTIERPREGGGS